MTEIKRFWPGRVRVDQRLQPTPNGWFIYGYGSIPMNTIFRGMNIHKSQRFWCELQGYLGFWHTAIFHGTSYLQWMIFRMIDLGLPGSGWGHRNNFGLFLSILHSASWRIPEGPCFVPDAAHDFHGGCPIAMFEKTRGWPLENWGKKWGYMGGISWKSQPTTLRRHRSMAWIQPFLLWLLVPSWALSPRISWKENLQDIWFAGKHHWLVYIAP